MMHPARSLSPVSFTRMSMLALDHVPSAAPAPAIPTPDRRLRVFVSSTLDELAPERTAARVAIESMHLAPVMFEAGARAHGPRELYRSYLAQSDVFVGIYWRSGGWTAPGEQLSGLADELRLSEGMPRLVYVKRASDRSPELQAMLAQLGTREVSYRHFETPEELRELVADDLAALLTERFAFAETGSTATAEGSTDRATGSAAGPVGGPALPRSTSRSVPIPLTTLIGRDRELARAGRWLNGGTRLLTFTGPGGIGKTALAFALAENLRDSFADGVELVDLSSARSEQDVVAIIAAQLDAPSGSMGDPMLELRSFLRDRRMLLVLDNFERVLDAAPLVTQFLNEAPGLTVVVTSRAALRLRGERVLPIAPLPVPVSEQRRQSLQLPASEPTPQSGSARANPQSWRTIAHAPAVRLFVERARNVDPDFALTAENAADVAEIVRRLDGIPLAIELAAARIPLLPPKEMLARLGDRFEVLTGGARDAPERHRTMAAAIRWSYEALGSEEQRVFSQLAAFRGGFTIEAAERVVSTDDDLLGILSSLVTKSLVRSVHSDGRVRLSMLETIREFATEVVSDRCPLGERAAVLERHARFFAELVLGLEHELDDPRKSGALIVVRAERGNIRAALDYLLESGDLTTAVRVGWAMWKAWWFDGRAAEGAAWFSRMVQAARTEASPELEARGLVGGGLLALGAGSVDAGRCQLVDGLRLARECDDDSSRALAAGALGHLAVREGRLDDAALLFEESIPTLERIGDAKNAVIVRILSGGILFAQKRFADAAADFERDLADARVVGDGVAIVLALYNLAITEEARGELERADRLLAEGCSTAAAMGRDPVVVRFLKTRARIAETRGDAALAARLRVECRGLVCTGLPWLDAYGVVGPEGPRPA